MLSHVGILRPAAVGFLRSSGDSVLGIIVWVSGTGQTNPRCWCPVFVGCHFIPWFPFPLCGGHSLLGRIFFWGVAGP